MRTVTATEASRSFAALLDEAEHGETVIVTRGGKRVATLGPANVSNGAEFLALLDSTKPDDEFEADILAVRASAVAEGPAWPDD